MVDVESIFVDTNIRLSSTLQFSPLDSTGEPAGRWAGDAREPARLVPYVVTDAVVSLRSVSAQWRCTSGLALLHGVASDAWGETPVWSASTQQWTWPCSAT
jgi:hypothetical protein